MRWQFCKYWKWYHVGWPIKLTCFVFEKIKNKQLQIIKWRCTYHVGYEGINRCDMCEEKTNKHLNNL